MSSYIQARINTKIDLLNADLNKLQHLMIMMEKLRDAENIDFKLQLPLLDLEGAIAEAAKLVQQVMRNNGLKPTDPKELESEDPE